jgi:eukaryotic-like serine/threonine-protein kinase
VGIVHRDLKPGNIMLTKSGASRQGSLQAKLLDFGLAKTGAPAVAGSLSMLPTIPPGQTQPGAILGTFQYMAPEQLEGKEADARTDIFAFGVVLFEVVTGRKAFDGKSQASLIAAILEREPAAMSTLQPRTPTLLDHIATRCLAKDPGARWQSTDDLLCALKWVADARVAPGKTTAEAGRRLSWDRFAWVLAGVGALIAVTATMSALRPSSPTGVPEMRLDIATPRTTDPVSFALSPDGLKLVFGAESAGRPSLWLRTLNAATERPLEGTEGARYPFWSPDSRWVGFFANNRLKTVDVSTGALKVLTIATPGRGGTWNRDGSIVFSSALNNALFRVPEAGGERVQVTRLEGQQSGHCFPQFLPDGRHFMYYAEGPSEARGVYLAQLDTSETRRLLDADSVPVYTSGQLLFVRQGSLFAQPFDAARLALTGNPSPVADRVAFEPLGYAALSVSSAGAVMYRAGTRTGQRRFMWFNRRGEVVGAVGGPDDATPLNPSLSPNGLRVVFSRTTDNADIWILDVVRGVMERFTSNPAVENRPIWSHDGTRIVFARYNEDRTASGDLYEKPTNGSGPEEAVPASPGYKTPTDWSPDGRFLLYDVGNVGEFDIWALPINGDGKPFPIVQTMFDERQAQFSPDGKWIAYQSNETGQFEIYVQPFPGSGTKQRISASGGAQVRWRKDGRELFFIALDSRLMAAPVELDSRAGVVTAGASVPLFETRIGGAVQGVENQQYDVATDGQRFLMNTLADEATAPITTILNRKMNR